MFNVLADMYLLLSILLNDLLYFLLRDLSLLFPIYTSYPPLRFSLCLQVGSVEGHLKPRSV